MRIIRTLFFYCSVLVSFFIGSAITLAIALFSKDRIHIFQNSAHIWAKFLLWSGGVRLTVQGAENVPKEKAVIFASNHQGNADILILLASIPKYFRFIVKKELFKVPLMGWYMKQAGYISIDREKSSNALRTLIKAGNLIKAGESILIFPEGTRSRDGNLGEFKRGSLLMAEKTNADIIPVAINGSFHLQPPESKTIRPGKVLIKFGKPMQISGTSDEGMQIIRDKIAEMLKEKP